MVRDTTTVITPTAAKIRLTVLGFKLLNAVEAAEVTEDTVVGAADVLALEGEEGALIYIMLSL